VTCRAAGFKQADSRVAIFREAGGKYAPGRAGTDDDVVEPVLGVTVAATWNTQTGSLRLFSLCETAASAKTE
jgi:hypothetical protein